MGNRAAVRANNPTVESERYSAALVPDLLRDNKMERLTGELCELRLRLS